MKTTIEQRLLDTVPNNQKGNELFIERTMKAVKKSSAHETFSQVIRTTDVTKKENFMTKLKNLPRFASLGLATAAVMLVGGTTYAAINWFGTDVKTNSKDNIVKVSAKDCPDGSFKLRHDTDEPDYKLEKTYTIHKPELISEQDIKKDQFVECEQRGIDQITRQSFPGIYSDKQYGEKGFEGLYIANSNYGTVSSVQGSDIVISDIPVQGQNGKLERSTATLTLAKDTQVLSYGQKTSLSDLKPGDQIYFTFQNKVISGDDPYGLSLSAPSKERTILRVLAKTQYNYKDLDKVNDAMFNQAFSTSLSVDLDSNQKN